MTLAVVTLAALEIVHQLYFRWRCHGFERTTADSRAGALWGVAGAALLGLVLSTAGGAGPQLALMAPIVFLYSLSIAKGRVLAEPIVWPDLFLASQILRNPTVYHLPLGTAGSCTALALAITGLLVLLHQLQLLSTVVVAACILAGVWAALSFALAVPLQRCKEPLETRLLTLPHWGCHSLGFPLALLLQGAILSRPRRCRPRSIPRIEAPCQLPPLLLMLQLESFCDPDRFQPAGHSELSSDLRDVLARLRRRSSQWGELAVPCFGANTVRAEYTVITAEPPQAQGLRCLNPYLHRPAGGPPGAIAELRAAGVKTTFFHANTGRFFNRIDVLPRLGFSRLVFAEDWPIETTARRYASDREIQRFLLSRIVPDLDADRPQLVFAASIEAHSPYIPSPAWGETPEQVWQRHSHNSLTMLEDLLDQLDALPHPVGVCVFGDHRPPLPAAEGSGQSTTDYLLINSGATTGDGSFRVGTSDAVPTPCAMEASELLPRFLELQLQASHGPGPTVSASPSHQHAP